MFSMWAVMMVPSASPVTVLFAEINRRRSKRQGPSRQPRCGPVWSFPLKSSAADIARTATSARSFRIM